MIEVTHYSGVHQGGTKEYNIYLFHSKAQSAVILVKRWGKIGTAGQVKIELYHRDGNSHLESALNERRNKGYDMRRQPLLTPGPFSTAAEALRILPVQHQRSISNSQLATIDPANHTAGDKSSHDPLAASRAAMVAEMQRQAREAKEASAKAEAEAEQQALKSNPIYGMF